MRHRGLMPGLLSAVVAALACSDSATAPAALTPASAVVEVDGVANSDNILLLAGATVPAEVRLFNADGTELSSIEDESFVKLTFAPPTLATVTDVPNEHFHKTLTAGGTIESGLAIVTFGHDTAANELSFPPYTVTVVAAGDIR